MDAKFRFDPFELSDYELGSVSEKSLSKKELLEICDELGFYIPESGTAEYLRYCVGLAKKVKAYTDNDSKAQDVLFELWSRSYLTNGQREHYKILHDYENALKFKYNVHIYDRVANELQYKRERSSGDTRNYSASGDGSTSGNIVDVSKKKEKAIILENKMAGQERKPFMKPDLFSGDNTCDFEEWLRTFQRAARINGWKEEDKVVFLPVYLSRAALNVFDLAYDANEQITFQEAIKILKTRFSNPVAVELRRCKLDARTKLPSESYAQYISEVMKLCDSVEKNMPIEQVITYVIKGLDIGALQHVSLLENKTIEELEVNLARYEKSRFLLENRLNLGRTRTDVGGSKSHQSVEAGMEALSGKLQVMCNQISKLQGKFAGLESRRFHNGSDFTNYSGTANNANFGRYNNKFHDQNNGQSYRRFGYSSSRDNGFRNNNNGNDDSQRGGSGNRRNYSSQGNGRFYGNADRREDNPELQKSSRTYFKGHKNGNNNSSNNNHNWNNFTNDVGKRDRWCSHCRRDTHNTDVCFFKPKNGNTGSDAKKL
jgi:hypothetical protein